MFSIFKSRASARSLDGYLIRYLTAHYGMNADELGKMQFTTSKSKLASRNVTTFRIFDPSMIGNAADRISYADLEGERAALQFEGTFASDKTVTEIRDLRKRV